MPSNYGRDRLAKIQTRGRRWGRNAKDTLQQTAIKWKILSVIELTFESFYSLPPALSLFGELCGCFHAFPGFLGFFHNGAGPQHESRHGFLLLLLRYVYQSPILSFQTNYFLKTKIEVEQLHKALRLKGLKLDLNSKAEEEMFVELTIRKTCKILLGGAVFGVFII